MARILHTTICLMAMLNGLAEIAKSQPLNLEQVYTPPGLEPGTPAHSYALSGFDNISYFNGHVNFHLPLLQIGGRGQAGYILTLPFESRFDLLSATSTGTLYNTFVPQYFNVYNTSNTNVLYTPGVVNGRWTGSLEDVTCTDNTGMPIGQYSQSVVTRLTFVESDGSQHELVDVGTNGAPKPAACPTQPPAPPPQGFNRGTVFVSRDSSALKFLANQNVIDPGSSLPGTTDICIPGTLYFPDGRAYTVTNVGTSCQVTRIRDRNGNIVTLAYNGVIGAAGSSITIVDSAGRQITVTSSGTQDKIQYPAFASNIQHTITVNYASLGTVLRADYTTAPAVTCSDGSLAPPGIQTESQLFPESKLSMPQCFNPNVMASVVLADNQSYQFHYNPYGELARVDLPTGGAYEYDIGGVLGSSTSGAIGVHGKAANDPSDPANDIPPFMLYRRVTERRVYKDGSTLEGKVGISVPAFAPGTDGTLTTVSAYDAAGNVLSTETHSFYALPTTELYCQDGGNPCYLQDEWYPSWQEGKEFETDWLQVGSTTVLRKLRHSWFNAAASGSPKAAVDPPPASDPSLDPQVLQTDTTLDTGLVGRRAFGYDAFNNLTDSSDYDYASTPPGSLLRHVHTDYIADTNYTSGAVYLPSLPILQRTDLGNTTTISSQTQYQYDNYGATAACPDSSSVPVLNAPQPGPLCTHANIVQMDPAYASGGVTQRGNVTRVQRTGSPSPDIFTYQQYDVAGNVVRKVDANGNQSQLDYDSNSNTYGFLSRLTNALSQSTSLSWDLNIGKPISIKDPNQQATGYDYTDPLDRLKTINYPDGGQTIFSYPSPTQIQQTQKISSSVSKLTTSIFDGLGRLIQTQLSDPEGTDYVDTTYDAGGRVYSVSNPHRSAASSTDGTTYHYYDALGRITQVTQPDTSTILTAYTGRATQVQDEGNGTQRVTRISQVDGLGRLTSLCEVAPGPFVGPAGASSSSLIGSAGTPAACALDIGGTGFLTTYQYDALDNLLQVNQSGIAPRTFTYDSLSRLLSASNPESGATSYTYDADGNVHTKTDARNITTTYSYDALNRPTGKTYSDGTPAATFNYDQTSALGVTLANTIGRKSSESTAGSLQTGSVFSYDKMGRVADNSQCTPQNCGTGVFAIQYTQYDLLGNLLSATNAAGVTFTYTYNEASHLTSISTNFVDATHPGTLLSQGSYNAPGSLKTVLLGNGLTETRNYNSRLWLTSLTAGTVYSLNMASYAPNGDVLAANDSVNGNWTYSYDPFNRVVGSNQNNGQAVYSYVYDRFGNRWQQNGPYSMQLTFTGNNPSNPQNKNRMDGYSYDAAGNLLNAGSHQYFYDAENRLIQVDGTSGNCSTATACYVYEAEGRRVRKATSSGALDFLYDSDGHKVAEVDPTGTFLRGELFAAGRHFAVFAPDPGPTGATFFMHADWLATERARTNMTGTACETIGSLPFGDGQTISDSCGDSAGDVSPLHFTGKERDAESGLDYFGARYFSAAQGRFTSPDWSEKPQPIPYADLKDPQSLNLYAYVRNNPLRNRDLDGHWCVFGVGTTCTSTPPPPPPRLGGGPSSSTTRGGVAGAASGTGGLLAHDANVRADYVTRVEGALTDRGQWSATRAGVRVEARASTSGIGTGIAAMADSAPSGGGGFTATNTRQSVNALAENSGTLGRGLVAVGVTIAVVDVATAPEGQRGQTAAGEAGSLAVGAGGAWAGAELGAAIGSVFPGPGTVVGGIVGSLVGGFFGGQAGHDIGTQAYDDIVH